MKKLLPVLLLASSFNLIHAEYDRDWTKQSFPLKINGQWHFCYETNNGDEQCTPADLANIKEIHAAVADNEQKATELMHNIILTEIKYLLLTLKMQAAHTKQEKKSTPEERKASEEEFKTVFPESKSEIRPTLLPSALGDFNRKPHEEFTKSILSEEEYKMYVQLQEMYVEHFTKKNACK